MYACPSKLKSAPVGGRSTKNDDCTAHGKHPDDPSWSQTGAGLYCETRNGRKRIIPKSKVSEFFRRYKDCASPAERNALVVALGS